jgi:uncharacterized protein (DUF2062 family)
MKSWFKKHFHSTLRSLQKTREIKVLKPYLKSSSFWSFDCEHIARGIAAGLAGAVIPGFQIFYAGILVIVFRGNLPIALLATFITNPLTAIPIIYFICFIGNLFNGNEKSSCMINNFQWDFSSFHVILSNFSDWILQFGKSFLMGVPVVSISLAVIGYCGTHFIWKISIYLFSSKKKK